MTHRTSISLSTPQIEQAVKDVSKRFYRNNKSAYIESLIIEDLVKHGMDRNALLNEHIEEKASN